MLGRDGSSGGNHKQNWASFHVGFSVFFASFMFLISGCKGPIQTKSGAAVISVCLCEGVGKSVN